MNTPDDQNLIHLAGNVRFHESALRLTYSRSSGPGGQNVNKVNSRVQCWLPISALVGMTQDAIARLRQIAPGKITDAGEIYIEAQTFRTQEGNRSAALERIAELILQAVHVPRKRRKTKPTKGSKQRRLQGKKIRSQIKQGRKFTGE